ncbi:MAG: FkbM family methyltransferase [Rhodocyclaceae bacterium]|nr:FkbM family methyltransferase [Rhodocyclaceae bacterium]MBX3667016.1 FkbM family methyltransferase [Rhodocyclaceae bacterium]
MNLLDLIKRLVDIRPTTDGNPWVIDGGCNIGQFTRAAMLTFPAHNFLAFEPDPATIRTARENFVSCPRVELVEAALGSSAGRAELFRGPMSATNSLLPRPDSKSKPYYPESAHLAGGTSVNVVTLDEECARRQIKDVDLLKLDLQGGELSALTGAANLLASGSIRVLLVEAVFVEKYQNQPLLWQLWQCLAGHGYSLYSLQQVKIGIYDSAPPSLRDGQWNQCDAIFLSAATREILDC